MYLYKTIVEKVDDASKKATFDSEVFFSAYFRDLIGSLGWMPVNMEPYMRLE